MSRDRRSLALLFAVYFLQGMCFYGPVATLYRLSAGLNVFQIGLLEGISLALSLALELPWGRLADRLGHRRTITLCMFLFALSKVVFWRAETFGGFLAERLLLAVTLSGLSGCDSAYLFACAGEDQAQKLFGRWEAVQTAGLLLAAAASSLYLRDQYRLAGLWTVVSYTAAALLSLGLGEPERTPAPSAAPAGPSAGWREALGQTRVLAPFLLGAALLSGTAQFVTVFLNQLLYRRSGLPTTWYGALYALTTLAALLGARSHRLTGRLGVRRGGSLLFLLGTGACLLALVPVPAAAILGVVLLKAAAALFSPLSLTLQNAGASPGAQATQLSCNAMVTDLVVLALTPALGRAADESLPGALAFAALACLAGAVLFRWGLGRIPWAPRRATGS